MDDDPAARPVGGASIELHMRRMREWAARTDSLESGANTLPPWPEADPDRRLPPRHDR